MNGPQSVNLAPTIDGYEQIARRFLQSTVDDAAPDRRQSARTILGGLIELVAYLAVQPDGAERISRLQSFVGGRQ